MSFSKFSSLSVHMKKIWSIDLLQNQGFISCVFKNFVSLWSIKIQAYGGANLSNLSNFSKGNPPSLYQIFTKIKHYEVKWMVKH